MYVLSQGNYHKVYDRKDGSQYYMLDGGRRTVRSNQKLYESKGEKCRGAKKAKCGEIANCKWMKGKGCRGVGSVSRKESAARKLQRKAARSAAQEAMFMRADAKRSAKREAQAKRLAARKSAGKKSARKLKACKPGQVRNPLTNRCHQGLKTRYE